MRIIFRMIALCFFVTLIEGLEVSVTFPDLPLKKDNQGNEVATAAVGQAFIIAIEMSGAHEATDEITAKGFEPFRVLSKSVSERSSMINGNISTTSTINIQVKGFKPGVYRVGPVIVRSGGKTATSSEVLCQVEARKKEEEKPTADGRELEVELLPAKKEIFWGEPIDITIRYLVHSSPIYQLLPEIPEQGNFFKKNLQDKGWREILRNGVVCKVYEQVVTFLPVKAGAAKIGPMLIHYTVPVKQRHMHGGMEHFFNIAFGPQAEQKEIEAAAVDILVKPLPKTSKQVSLVGHMTAFDISVDKPTVQVNEPIKLIASITGNGNLEFTEDVPLTLPAGCKIFKAKTSMHDVPGGKGLATKKIEYVLQVNKSGQVIFPAQELTYFDPEAAMYKKLPSQPIELFLTGDAVEQPSKTVDELAKEVTEDASSKKDKGHLFIFDEAGHNEVVIGWWLFLFLMLLPLSLHMQSARLWFEATIVRRLKKAPTKKDVIKQAEKELAAIRADKKAQELYQFFTLFMAVLWNVHEQEVTEQFIEMQLTQKGWSEDKVREFISYLQLCASLHFTRQQLLADIYEMLLKKSEYWVLLLGK